MCHLTAATPNKMMLLLLFVLCAGSSRGEGETTLSFSRLVIHRCIKAKLSDGHQMTVSTALNILYRCMKNSFPCKQHIKASFIDSLDGNDGNLYVIHDVEKKLCAFLAWRPLLDYDFILHTWHIRTKERWFVQISFENFYIPYTENCAGNRMVLAKYKSGSRADVLAEYCGYRLPWTYTFGTHTADVRVLWANRGTPETRASFQAHFETLIKKPKDISRPVRKSETELYPWQELPIDRSRSVYAFEVHTHIENILQAHVSTGLASSTEWFMYDGPTESFPRLGNHMRTSGFLLFIKVHGYDTGLSFNFRTVQVTDNDCRFSANNKVRIYEDNARLLFCRQWFSTPYFPAIYLEKFNVIAPEPETCKFLGFSLGLDVNGSTSMLRPFCTSVVQSHLQPYFVAPNSRIFILIYAYQALHIDIDVNIFEVMDGDIKCPGLPVVCQSSNFPIPDQIQVANRARLATGTSNHLELLSNGCVLLFRLPNMIQCSDVTIVHTSGSSFAAKLYSQQPGNWFHISTKLTDMGHEPVVTYNNYNIVGLLYQFVGLGSQQVHTHFGGFRSDTRYSKIAISNESIPLDSSTATPHMWYLKLESTTCFSTGLHSAMSFYFKDLCGNLRMLFYIANYEFTIDVPNGQHISFHISHEQVHFCRKLCSHGSFMEVTDKDMVFLFSGESWNTKWRSMSNTAKFSIKVEQCLPHFALLCDHKFSYSASKNRAVPEAENTEGPSQCRIGESEYRVLKADTWMDAKEQCEKEAGWKMLSISSRLESDVLLTNAALHPQCSEKWKALFSAELVFIGLHKSDQNNQWEWVSREKIKISDWLSTSEYATTYPKVYFAKSNEEKMKSAQLKQKFRTGSTMFKGLSELCAGMIVFNQHKNPKWLAVRCTSRFDAVVVCEKNDEKSTVPPSLTTPQPGVPEPLDMPTVPINHSFCPVYWIWSAGRCWQLVDLQKSTCPAISNALVVNNADLLMISQLLSLWYTQLQDDELVWIGRVSNSSQCVVMQWKDEGFQPVNDTCALLDRALYALCETRALDSSSLTCPNGTMMCADNSCILSYKQCDGKDDCPQGEDESECPMKPPCGPGRVKCPQSDACIETNLLCEGNDECGVEQYCQLQTQQCTPTEFKCGKKCIHIKHQCNLEINCSLQDDERQCSDTQYCKLLDNFTAESRLLYRLPSQLQCAPNPNGNLACTDFGEEFSRCRDAGDAHQCFPRYRRCFYDLDIHGNVLFCRNRQHLENCESFECPNAYKCPASYCVPYVRLCDETVDCPGGEDELNCNGPDQCEGKIRCSDKCILKSDWCNGVVDCPGAEDEKLCDECPSGCVCELHYTSCFMAAWLPNNHYFHNKNSLVLEHMALKQDGIVNLFANNEDLVQLDLSGNLLTSGSIDQDPKSKFKLIDLNLANNLIKQINSYDFLNFPYLMHLNLTGNPLQSLSDYSFWGLAVMTDFDLSGLVIDNIYDQAFSGMHQLRNLNLSYNQIHVLSSESFSGLQRLQVLDLANNPLFLIDKETFQPAPTLELLLTPAFKFCCAASHVGKCFPEPSEFSSCSDLMANTILKVFIWILAFTTFTGNIGVIVWRKQQETFSTLNFLVQHLGFADMTMGLYLIIIAIADFYYRGHYYLYDEQWRESAFCKMAGFLSMLSSEMSVFVLLMIVTDRVNVVGLARPGMGEKFAYVYIVFGWIAAIALSVLPIVGLPYFGSGKYIQNGACFLFNITEGKVAGWEYATAIFIVFNLFALLVLVCGYTFIFISVSLKTGFKGNIEGQVARKLALVVFTDCCCWIPPITIGIMSLMDVPVNPQLAVWVAVFAFPLNSTINPLLYTFSSMNCCQEVDEVEDDYISHVHHIDEDGHSISDDGDFAGPSTSTAVARTIVAKQNIKPKKSLTKRTTPRPRSTRKSVNARHSTPQSGVVAIQKAYILDQPGATLDDIPEVCDVSEEDETNVQISVSVAIKGKGHQRSSSTVSKVSVVDGAATNAKDDDEKFASYKTTFSTALPDNEAAINIELANIKQKE